MNEQVLVVDDDERVLESVLRALQIEDISCMGVDDPRKAVDTFKANPADVVVVDFIYDKTPELTGLDVITAIRKIKPLTRTILISGRIDHDKLGEKEVEQELQAKVSCDYYLPKSGSRDVLISTVKLALEQVQSRATDWKNIAKEYGEASQVTPEDVRRVNEVMKDNIVAATHEERER
jgi:two-component system OmpR family response regulator